MKRIVKLFIITIIPVAVFGQVGLNGTIEFLYT